MNKVKKNKTFEYEETAEDFCGLTFHCPKCNQEIHIHVTKIEVKKK